MIRDQHLKLGRPAATPISNNRQAATPDTCVAAPEIQNSLAVPAAVSAAQRWRERLGYAGPPSEPGTAALRWRERLAARDGQRAPATSRRRLSPEVAHVAGGRMPPELDDDSALMEACRLLRLNLRTSASGVAPIVLIAPSVERSCALVAAGVALALAEDGCRTLLVDADLRAPSLHYLFSLEPGPGFAQVIASGSANDAPTDTLADRLWLLRAGGTRTVPALATLPALEHITECLAHQYDAVIYHIAGLQRPAEALQLSMHVGRAMFTLRAGIDTADPVRRMRDTLERAGVQVLGFALLGGDA
jgi:Mrp family chromosome partitioning ATPase